MHAVPFIPTISFKLAERDRFYVDASAVHTYSSSRPFLFPRVIIQIRKLLVVPARAFLQIHFVFARLFNWN